MDCAAPLTDPNTTGSNKHRDGSLYSASTALRLTSQHTGLFGWVTSVRVVASGIELTARVA